jgi:ubiquinone/menaquinone biosynthesis C-methylase UbiE
MPTNDYRHSAERYALRGLLGTDLLAFRAVADRIGQLEFSGKSILDIGCGSGRSTRFLRDLGLAVTGVDVSAAMVAEAQRLDPPGHYVSYSPGEGLPFTNESFDLFFSSWVILEQESRSSLIIFLSEAARILKPGGLGFVVTNTPQFYQHRWVSCEINFPENQPPLVSGQKVKARLMPEGVIVSDVFWSDNDYRNAISHAGLSLAAVNHPQAPSSETGWLDETKVAPYVVYEIQK